MIKNNEKEIWQEKLKKKIILYFLTKRKIIVEKLSNRRIKTWNKISKKKKKIKQLNKMMNILKIRTN